MRLKQEVGHGNVFSKQGLVCAAADGCKRKGSMRTLEVNMFKRPATQRTQTTKNERELRQLYSIRLDQVMAVLLKHVCSLNLAHSYSGTAQSMKTKTKLESMNTNTFESMKYCQNDIYREHTDFFC